MSATANSNTEIYLILAQIRTYFVGPIILHTPDPVLFSISLSVKNVYLEGGEII